MEKVDVVVVGAGPAGCMAAIRAARKDASRVVLIEGNPAIGKKILITGKGRCNLTNTASLDVFIEKFRSQGSFLRSALTAFSNQDLIDFFKTSGLRVKIERQGRVFPVTDKAESVVEVLAKELYEKEVKAFYNTYLLNLEKKSDLFDLLLADRKRIKAEKVILATGGMSFKSTGSSGSGFLIAKKLGHTITPLLPGLVPLETKEKWLNDLQGLTLKKIKIRFLWRKKKIVSDVGELLFTHFGVSGPLVLDLSSQIAVLLADGEEVRLLIDLKPGLSAEQLETRLLREFCSSGNMMVKNYFKGLLPQRLIPVFLQISAISDNKQANQVTQKERQRMIELLKGFPLGITGTLSINRAMVTAGGVNTKEINSRTMESRVVPGLYFAGEIIAGSVPSGGYNLQQAFSTGYLAGEKAANA